MELGGCNQHIFIGKKIFKFHFYLQVPNIVLLLIFRGPPINCQASALFCLPVLKSSTGSNSHLSPSLLSPCSRERLPIWHNSPFGDISLFGMRILFLEVSISSRKCCHIWQNSSFGDISLFWIRILLWNEWHSFDRIHKCISSSSSPDPANITTWKKKIMFHCRNNLPKWVNIHIKIIKTSKCF